MSLLLAILLAFFLPSLEEGRVIPKKEDAKCLPSKFQRDKWLTLERLEQKENFTLFSEAAYKRLRESYQNGDCEEAYWVAYEEIGGKQLHLTSGSTLSLPTRFELEVEAFYLDFPWSALISGGFALALLMPGVYFLPYILLTLDLLIRVFLLKRPPVTSMAETYLWVGWVATTLPLFLREKTLFLPASLLTAFLFLFAGEIPLSLPPPVLNSNFWLTIHVLMVVGSYALFFLGGLLAHFFLFKNEAEPLFRPLPSLLFAGVILLIAGTLLGGVWAHVSWGRFWDWDPKEAWAFISSLFYLTLVHLYRYRMIGSFGLAMGAIGGLIVITFTWYGVNYLLGVGLHSYGFGQGQWIPFLVFIAIESLVMTIALTRKKQREKNRRVNCEIKV